MPSRRLWALDSPTELPNESKTKKNAQHFPLSYSTFANTAAIVRGLPGGYLKNIKPKQIEEKTHIAVSTATSKHVKARTNNSQTKFRKGRSRTRFAAM